LGITQSMSRKEIQLIMLPWNHFLDIWKMRLVLRI
jgi:hypothetical protein